MLETVWPTCSTAVRPPLLYPRATQLCLALLLNRGAACSHRVCWLATVLYSRWRQEVEAEDSAVSCSRDTVNIFRGLCQSCSSSAAKVHSISRCRNTQGLRKPAKIESWCTPACNTKAESIPFYWKSWKTALPWYMDILFSCFASTPPGHCCLVSPARLENYRILTK